MTIRPNVSGGAGGERWDRRAVVKTMARGARRAQDNSAISEGLGEYVATCDTCHDPIDYCLGHGVLG